MNLIHAIYEGGVFRPTEPVVLPESCHVEFEPRVVPESATTPSLEAVYAILRERYNSGDCDVAARHNEHQP